MSQRLLFACLGGCMLVLGGRGTSRARAVTEVEGAAYEGESAGHWGCGPSARVRYGGLAAQVRHSQRKPDHDGGLGASVVAGAALELQRVRTEGPGTELDPSLEPGPFSQRRIDVGAFGAGHLRGGYHFKYIGVEAGLVLWSGYRGSPNSTGVGVSPQLELTLGRRDVFYMVGGLGVSQLTQTMRYSLPYLGAGLALGPRSILEGRVAATRSGPDLSSSLAPRFDLFWIVPLDEGWSLRAGTAIGGDHVVDREASLGCVLNL